MIIISTLYSIRYTLYPTNQPIESDRPTDVCYIERFIINYAMYTSDIQISAIDVHTHESHCIGFYWKIIYSLSIAYSAVSICNLKWNVKLTEFAITVFLLLSWFRIATRICLGRHRFETERHNKTKNVMFSKSPIMEIHG